ncbi:MAG: bifunctional DNA-formamidopyrimidine glycosylase/DNA-(apurinic or apyrimidinic site) lyase [Vibrionaceae bacterium]
MPELPEVEVSRLGISEFLQNKIVSELVVRERRLRWPICENLFNLQGAMITSVTRRAKYLQINTQAGSAIVHLGMSGSLRILPQTAPAAKHDHVELKLNSGMSLRYNDPRRFGAWLWQNAAEVHPVLQKLGPEPLSDHFDAHFLWKKCQKRRISIKQLIMDGAIVVGVGNIYASEALFAAKIHPLLAACQLELASCERLVHEIKTVLTRAIAQGGTTLRDFSQVDGKPGYFAQQLSVYGRNGKPCITCNSAIISCKIGQRNTFFCPNCQQLP